MFTFIIFQPKNSLSTWLLGLDGSSNFKSLLATQFDKPSKCLCRNSALLPTTILDKNLIKGYNTL